MDIDLITEKINHKIYSPNKKGVLTLVKENSNLASYPKDLPPKFKDNKPSHPEFVGGEAALYQWVEKNIYPVLEKKYKKKEKGNSVLILDINPNEVPTFVEIKNLNISDTIKKQLTDIVKTSPVWKTNIQGYDVSGIVFIPLEY